VWRFDINPPAAPAKEVVLLANLVRGDTPQPITTRPELALIRVGNQQLPVVTVATGRYLGSSDVSDKSVQSVYTFRDHLTSDGLGNLRANPSMVQKRLLALGDAQQRSVSDDSVDWLINEGWYVDLDTQNNSVERVVLDPEQQLGVLSIVSNVPDSNACRPKAESWSYAFNYTNGNYLPIGDSKAVARRVSNSSMIAGTRLLRVGSQLVNVLTDDGGKVSTVAQPVDAGGAPGARRVAWRELD